jgi:hypothetical protein
MSGYITVSRAASTLPIITHFSRRKSFRPPTRAVEIEIDAVLHDDALTVLVITNGRERRWVDVSRVNVLDYAAVERSTFEQTGWSIH